MRTEADVSGDRMLRHFIFWACYALAASVSYVAFDMLTAPYHRGDRVVAWLTILGFFVHAAFVVVIYALYLRRKNTDAKGASYSGLAFGLAALISQFLFPEIVGPML